jgi:hypothetical protein
VPSHHEEVNIMAQATTPIPRTVGHQRRTIVIAIAIAVAAAAVISALVVNRDTPSSGVGTVSSALTEAEASDIAAGYFAGYNDGDYTMFSEHFDAAMKGAITEDVFTTWHEQTSPLLGAHVVTTNTELVGAETPDHVSWVFTADFAEEQDVIVRLTFPTDGTTIAGAHISSEKLGTR